VCDALEHAHERGLVHRDLKPGNVLVRRDGPRLEVKLTDLGIALMRDTARMTRTGAITGTPAFMAPEQALGRDLDGRADLYALVGTIYNLTTGRAFFDEIKTARERIFAHMQKDPFEDASLLESYPKELAKLMRAGTAMNPKDRPDVLEFGRAFTSLV
jgi:serine/threonine-protein kinase